jgi:hypothetical protein
MAKPEATTSLSDCCCCCCGTVVWAATKLTANKTIAIENFILSFSIPYYYY